MPWTLRQARFVFLVLLALLLAGLAVTALAVVAPDLSLVRPVVGAVLAVVAPYGWMWD